MTWKSGRQSFVTVSVAEAELHAATQCVVLVKSVAAVADELLNTAHEQVIRVDNTAAITILKGSGQSSWRTRHLRVRANFVKELVDDNALRIEHVAGEEQLADLATKLVPRARLRYLLILWGFQGVPGDARAEKARMATLRVLCILLATMAVGAEGREQDARRDEEAYAGLSRTGNVELLILAIMTCVVAVAIWELPKWLFISREELDWKAERRQRKLERLRQLAREATIAEMDAPPDPVPTAAAKAAPPPRPWHDAPEPPRPWREQEAPTRARRTEAVQTSMTGSTQPQREVVVPTVLYSTPWGEKLHLSKNFQR